MNRSLAGLVLGSAVITFGSAAIAADSLEEVTVSAKRLEQLLPQQLAQYGTHVSTISREEVANGSYVDVAQALQALAPGLYVQNKNGPFDYADISLLGSRTSDVLWLIDGVRINNRLYGGTPPNDTLPAGIIERAEVLDGGQALFYGTQAVAGAINIVTKSFSEKAEGAFTAATDTNDSRHLDAYYSNAIDGHHFVVFGTRDDTDGYRAFRDQDYQPSSTHRNRQYDIYTIGAKYAYDFTDAVRLGASYIHTDGKLDYAYPFRVDRDVNKRKEDLATVKFDYDIAQTVGLYLKGYYHRWHTDYDTTYNDLASPGDKIVIYDNAFWGYDDRGINALARIAPGKGVEYYVGYDLQRYGGRDEVLRIEQHKETTQALFAQVRLTPELLPNTHLSAGVRYNDPDVGEAATVWNVGAQYDFTPNFFVRLNGGTNFRLPSAEELFADDPLDERGNPNLKPERTKSVNLSVGGKAEGATLSYHWEVIGYAREIDNLIDYADFDPVTEQAIFGNIPGKVKVRGGEIVVGAEVRDAWSTELSYSRNRSRQEGGDRIARIPESLAKATFDWHPSALPFGATLTVNYTGDTTTPVGPALAHYGEYFVTDLSGRYFLGTQRQHRLVLSLQNVFDKEYGRPARGCQDDPADGPYDCSLPYTYVNLGLPRTLRASYSYTF